MLDIGVVWSGLREELIKAELDRLDELFYGLFPDPLSIRGDPSRRYNAAGGAQQREVPNSLLPIGAMLGALLSWSSGEAGDLSDPMRWFLTRTPQPASQVYICDPDGHVIEFNPASL